MATLRSPARRRRKESRGPKIAFYSYCALVFFFLLVPLLIVIPISFSASSYLQFPPPAYSTRWYDALFSDRDWIDAAWRSVKIAVTNTVLATVLGTLVAFSLVRGTYRGKKFVEQLIMAPLILPTIVYAVSAYGLFSMLGLIGHWEGIALAHTIHALPLVVLVIGSALRTFDRSQEQAAQGLGASWPMAVLVITLPQIRPTLISAAFIAFISSFDELIIAMFLGGSNVTLPKKMFDNILFEIDPTIAAVSVLQIALVTALLIVVWKFGTNPIGSVPQR